MSTNNNKSIDQINSEIDLKMNDLFELFWEQTSIGINNQTNRLIALNAPQFVVNDHIKEKTELMKERFNEVKDVLKEEFKKRFINEQWIDFADSVPIISTKLSTFGNNDNNGFFIDNYSIERNRRSFIKEFYIRQCGYTQIITNYDFFRYWFKWVFNYSLKNTFWNSPIGLVKRMMTKFINFNEKEVV
jgi:hypothetical protein